jgi:hypothetical protein
MPTKKQLPTVAPNGKPYNFTERHRMALKVGKACQYVNELVAGKVEGDALRLRAAFKVIDKHIPDAPVEQHNMHEIKQLTDISPHKLLDIIEGRAKRIN